MKIKTHPFLRNGWKADLDAPVAMAWLTFETDKGEEYQFPLSPTQVDAIIYILGLSIDKHNPYEFTCSSNESLLNFINAIKDKFKKIED